MTIVKAKRKPYWRTMPCPMCGAKKTMREWIWGMPAFPVDESKFIIGGCMIEASFTTPEIACSECGWGGSKADLYAPIKQPTKLTSRFIEALNYANKWHSDQTRKASRIAYISHPVSVAGLIIEAGGTEDEVIAGLLHDVPEDCGGEPRLKEIKRKFGENVAEIVRACSDSLVEVGAKKDPWKKRKEDHLAKLWNSDDSVLLVTAADKAHNASAIVTDLRHQGDVVWKRFNASRDDIIWYYDEVLKILSAHGENSRLISQLRQSILDMKGIREI